MNQSDYDKIYPSLPLRIQEFLNSEDLIEKIKNTAILAKLNTEQTGRLSYIIGDVLLGKLTIKEFSEKIKSYLGITDPQAQIIKEIINKKVFEPLKDDLEKYKYLLPKTPFEIKKPIETQKLNIPEPKIPAETIPKSLEALTKETFTGMPKKEEVNKLKPFPDLSLPEIQEIKIERPVNKTGELKRVIVPSVSPEAQEKIHSKLMEAMKKKEAKPKIVEEMKKVIIEGIKKPPQQKPKPKTTPETEEATTSQVIGGEGQKFNPQEKTQKSPSQKPYIFDVKLKEEKTKKEEIQTEELIQYKKYQPKKPFGEA